MIILDIIFTIVCASCVVGACIVAYEWLTGKVQWSNDEETDDEW